VRQFKSLTSSDYKDYDLYPAAYGVTYFNDEVVAFNFKNDIDVSALVDNLGRPITELYLSIIKNDNDSNPSSINTQYWLIQQQPLPPPYNVRFWTKISAGYDLENDASVNYNIRSYGDTNYVGSTYYENIDESDNVFDGDIVEYNESELLERRLENLYHRVNTVYREFLNSIDTNKGNKKEGYIYTPFNLVKIREFSNMKFEIVVTSVDSAQKPNEINDPSAFLKFGIIKDTKFLGDHYCEKKVYPETKENLINFCNKAPRTTYLIIEDANTGSSLIQELPLDERMQGIRIIAVSHGGIKKEIRFLTATGAMSAGKTHFPKDAPWYSSFENELISIYTSEYLSKL
jgi:predicted phage terminase large subunit-like protein